MLLPQIDGSYDAKLSIISTRRVLPPSLQLFHTIDVCFTGAVCEVGAGGGPPSEDV